jgi:outer membrane protein
MTIPSAFLRILSSRPKLSASFSLVALALAAAAAPGSAFPQAAPQAAQQPAATAQSNTTLPLSPIEKAEKDGTALRISLKDLTKLALQNNLDIAIADTNEVLYQQRYRKAFAPYEPELIVGMGVQSSKSANTNVATASTTGNFNKFDRSYWNVQYAQSFHSGADLTVDYRTSRSDTTQAFALFNPQYSASSLITFTQPLRRNFRIDSNRSVILLANLDIKNNDSMFKKKVVDTIAKIQAQYWDLVSAIRDYDIKRESVKLAQIQLDNNKKKVEIGTLAPIGITEARADMASREVDLIQAEEKIYTTENTMRSLISNDRNADIWRRTIIPTDSAELKEVKVGLDTAIDTALANRPELEQLAIKLSQNDINTQLDQNTKKWRWDLVGSFGSVGVGGPQSFDTTGKPRVSPEFVGGLGNSYKTLFGEGLTNWSIGFNVRIPLRDHAIQAQMAEHKVQRQQTLMDRKNQEQTIIVEIRNAVQALDTNKKRVDMAKVARELAEEQLEGETKRFQAGLSENFRVLDRQRQLSQAQGVELRELITYKKSVIDLQKAMYTLLEANDFEIAKTSAESVPSLK